MADLPRRTGIDAMAIALFVVLMLAPLVSLLFGGYDELAERRVSARDFEPGAFAAHSDDYRSALLREAITGSIYGAATIKWRSEVDEELLGVGGSAGVLEGREGWLFSRDQFDGGVCHNRSRATLAMLTIAAMSEVAEGAGIQFVFSVAPDKMLVHPEKLTWRQTAYGECKRRNAQQWREVGRAAGIDVLDHLPALVGEPSPPRFFATDTHWNGYGATLAFEDLRARFLGPREWTPELGIGPSAVRDLMRNLRLDDQEADLVPLNAPPNDRQIPGATVIVHDSFYHQQQGRILSLFASSRSHDMNVEGTAPDALVATLTPDTTRLVVSTVERLMFPRFEGGDRPFTWSGLLGRALLARNAVVAERCTFSEAKPIATGGHGAAVVALPALPSGGRPCIRVRAAGPVRIVLPLREGATVAGAHLHAVELAPTPGDAAALVLPPRFSGRDVRVVPGGASGATVEIGVLAVGG